MTYLVGILVLALAIVALLVISQRHRRLNPRLPRRTIPLTPAEQLRRMRTAGTYRGIKIESHCAASAHVAGREYTFERAPTLPVIGCDMAVCECHYVGLPERRRLADRRSGTDRRHSIRLDSEDRRAERPRREDDINAWTSFSHL